MSATIFVESEVTREQVEKLLKENGLFFWMDENNSEAITDGSRYIWPEWDGKLLVDYTAYALLSGNGSLLEDFSNLLEQKLDAELLSEDEWSELNSDDDSESPN